MTIRKNYLGFMALLLSGSMFFVTSCDNNAPTDNPTAEIEVPETENIGGDAPRLAVAPPIKGLDVPFDDYKVVVTKGAKIETPTGSTIDIPANAFIDKDGNPIEGEVSIKFREFHNATDIVASGIPMHDPETGAYMETAGMFEIKGEHNGEEIFVKGDKDINVNLASYNEGNQFNFYELGSKDCRWKDMGTDEAKPNVAKINKLKALDQKLAKTNVGPRKANEVENYVFDMSVNYDRFPELKPFKNVIWEYSGQGPNPEKNEWIFSANWDDISLEKDGKGLYNLKLTAQGGKAFKTTVRPVLDGDDYEKALALFNKTKGAEVTQIKKEVVAERKRVEQQANLVRAFKVGGFGIFNWDVWHNPSRVRCNAEILVDNEGLSGNTRYSNISYFLVSNDKRSVVRYDKTTLNKFSFDPAQDNALLAITPEGTIAIFSAEDFKKLEIGKIKDAKALFNLASTTIQVKGMDDLDKAIAQAIG